mmetsp:Transcript_19780/g.40346  ORF Transcript_19780/g.40346 Transcript_19780/m.40346 type:complete len:162 (-) Transcript_19780:55-540(-)|eukprot:CAMPEP_0181323664 /NCGR_PEP_ID=MMETSP1101-20121128/19917_1 /TAXON_ID=46948 /ORGANISM="Rhodomonas abbreviata, Strain Caron Lab Isolate" /LENGTH=161 /DNA_ID=CAMNT_0023431729 /DNA_START=175 /DNA_END=660 /DNA_ORIENTATION=-
MKRISLALLLHAICVSARTPSPCEKCGDSGHCNYPISSETDPVEHEFCGVTNLGFHMCCPKQIDGLLHVCDKYTVGACRCAEKLCFTRDTLDTHFPYNAIICPLFMCCFFAQCALVWRNRVRAKALEYGEFDDASADDKPLTDPHNLPQDMQHSPRNGEEA